MKFEKITYLSVENKEPTYRDIISINGMCFYRSTGMNSAAPGTWFPFLGIQTEGKRRGWFKKNELDHYFNDDLVKKIKTHIKGDAILNRFSSVPALLISSLLGGGLWDKEGDPFNFDFGGPKAFKAYLMQTYPDFYATWPTLTVAEQGKEFEDIEAVNDWLVKKANVNTTNDLESLFISDLEKLTVPQASNNFDAIPTPNLQVEQTVFENIFGELPEDNFDHLLEDDQAMLLEYLQAAQRHEYLQRCHSEFRQNEFECFMYNAEITRQNLQAEWETLDNSVPDKEPTHGNTPALEQPKSKGLNSWR